MNFENRKISVSQQDIDNGVRSSTRRCPLARAIRRATGVPVSVGSFDVLFLFPKSRYQKVVLPLQMLEFRESFDLGKRVQPFSITLLLPK